MLNRSAGDNASVKLLTATGNQFSPWVELRAVLFWHVAKSKDYRGNSFLERGADYEPAIPVLARRPVLSPRIIDQLQSNELGSSIEFIELV